MVAYTSPQPGTNHDTWLLLVRLFTTAALFCRPPRARGRRELTLATVKMLSCLRTIWKRHYARQGWFLVSRARGARTFCRDTFVALCALLLNLCGLIWTIELRIVARLVAHVVTPHKYARLKLKYTRPRYPSGSVILFSSRLVLKTFQESTKNNTFFNIV